MTGHAFLAPSGADRWGPGRCPASPRMEALYPEVEDSPHAMEGTAAHIVPSEALSGRTVAIGQLAPNGIPVNAEMIDAAADLIRDVTDTMATWPGGFLRVEHRVSMAASVHAQNWGTPDVYYVVPALRLIFVWDYKYGHRYVDAFMNWQTIDYTCGALESEGISLADWGAWSCMVTIAQPRNYHPDGPLREWKFSGLQLLQYRDQLALAAVEAMAPEAPMRTGDHCRDCDARQACPALQRVAMSLVDMSLTGQPIDMPLDALGLELRIIRAAVKRLGARATGLEEQAMAAARQGKSIPWWRAEYSDGRTKWNLPVPQVIAIGEAFGLKLAKDAALTPTQAIKAGFDPDVVKQFSETPRGAMTLVPFDETDIAKRFS